MCVHRDTGAHTFAGAPEVGVPTRTDTRRHAELPTDTLAGTGVGREPLILHKAGPLRGAPRHRGPLLTKPPAGSKSDPPSRLRRGQGTRPPCPPPPPGSAPLHRSGRGRGRLAAAQGGSPRHPGPHPPPCARTASALLGIQGPQPGRSALWSGAVASRRPARVPGPTGAGVAISVLPSSRFAMSRPLGPVWPGLWH